MSDSAAVLQSPAHRLPRTVAPRRYELTLTPDLSAFTFEGEERVEVTVNAPTSEIILNAVELEIDEAALTDGRGRSLGGTVSLDEAEERAIISLDAPAEPGEWRLHLKFRGILNDKLHGFYRSTYRDDAGEHVIATTQFEATDARRAFPCWDEPDLKAVFAITLVVPEGLMAVSNGGVLSEMPTGSGQVAVKFADTIPMSTYLVAFIVGRLEATEPVDVDGTPLRVIHVPSKRRLAGYALEVGAFSLRFFSEYYGIPYPSDKLDMIALPDFASGAMENLGAVTFRETALLVDRETAALADLQRVADVIAHELAHMWFGDLVTMKWWNGLWLNEAFATFMEMLAVDAYKPEWQRWVSFGIGRSAAMATDALTTTRPIEFPVLRPEEAEGMFDILTYEKGAGVLRMLEQYLGGPRFQRGIRMYLDSHRLANAETTDLWDAIEEATGEPTRRIMDSWIFQGGLPLVSVEASTDHRAITVSQRRFRYLPDDQADSVRWQVPVILRVGTGGKVDEHRVLLGEGSTTIHLEQPAEWAVANAGGHGFYRVRYSSDLLRGLTANVQRDLSAIERFNLVGDAWASVVAGLTPIADFLDLTKLFQEESDRNVWVAVIGGFSYLHRMLPSERRPGLNAQVRDLVAPSVERLGWWPSDGEGALTRQLRGTVIGALGTLGEDRSIQTAAQALHDRFSSDRSAIDPDVVPAVIGIVAHTGGRAEYDEFVRLHKSAPTPQEEQRYLFALARFEHRDLIQATLDRALTDEVRTQNAPFLIGSLLENLTGGDLAWEFIKNNWETMVERFPDNTHVRMLGGITALSTPDLAADVEDFFKTHTVKQGQKTLDQHLERLQVNVLFRQREGDALAKLFEG